VTLSAISGRGMRVRACLKTPERGSWLVWVERPTWPLAAETCRRFGMAESETHLAGRPTVGLVARQNGPVARSTRITTAWSVLAVLRLERFRY
jgi:hypothetical protein